MSQNNRDEYKIPFGIHHPDFKSVSPQVPVEELLGDIYVGPGQPVDIEINANRFINPTSKRMYEIHQQLRGARIEYLDKYCLAMFEAESRPIRRVIDRVLGMSRPEPVDMNQLIQLESEIGASIFSGTEDYEHFVFFKDDNEKSWFSCGYKKDNCAVTRHYEVHDEYVLCFDSEDPKNGRLVEGEELDRFVLAAEIYAELVIEQLYSGKNSHRYYN